MVKKERKVYSEESVRASALEYFKGDSLAADVWIKKYCLKDENNLYELLPIDMHRRIAKELARIESEYPNPMSEDEIFETLEGFNRIVPGGSPMSGIGNDIQVVSLSNCFVVGSDGESDSYGGILKIDQEIVQLEKRRGGVGTDLSYIRPAGSPVKNSAITSTGVVPFMERYSNTTKEVAQDGRRGALMLSINIAHPDAEAFIDAKLTQGKVTGANVSVKITDEFMEAVKNGYDYIQRFPIDLFARKDAAPHLMKLEKQVEDSQYNTPIDIIDDNGVKIGMLKKVNAKAIWKKIIYNAWKCVPYDTEIPIYENDVYKQVKIGDLVENMSKNNTYEALSLNLETLKVERKKISDFQKYKNDKNVIKISTKSNAELSATEDHIIYLLRDGKIVSLPMSECRIGDYILKAKKTRTDNLGDDILNIDLSEFNNGSSITFDNFSSTLNTEEVKNILGKRKNGEFILNEHMRSNSLPVSDYLKISKIIDANNIIIKPNSTNNKNFSFSKEFELTNDLSLFIGLWFAEGSFHDNDVILHINKNEVSDYSSTFDIISKMFNTKWSVETINSYSKITFSSSALKRFFNSINIKYDNGIKVLPIWIYSLSSEKIGCFLNGLFSGDGTIGNNGTISFSQSNFELIRNVQQLLLTLGIHSKIRLSEKNGKKIILGKVSNIKNNYKLDIYREFNEIFNNKVSFILESKKNKLLNFLEYERDSFGIPLSKKTLNKLRLFGRKRVSKSILINKVKGDNTIVNSIIYDNDIIYDEIINISQNSENFEFVYDITVDDNHTFILSNGCAISNSAEPGILFWDNIIKESVPDSYEEFGFKTVSTNPCGEVPLCPYDSCRLLSLNLYSYVINPFKVNATFDFDLFRKDAKIAMRYMDDIIDLEIEKIKAILAKIDSDPENELTKIYEINLWTEILKKTYNGRRTGLGVTAMGDMLAALGLRYGTDEANSFAELVQKELKHSAYESSVIMAEERGAFPIYDTMLEIDNPFILRIEEENPELYERMVKSGRRNIALLTIAPTGSMSIETQTTSGCEPAFLVSYRRRRKINPQEKDARVDFVDPEGISWSEYPVFHHKFINWLEANDYDINVVMSMTPQQIDEIIKKSPYYKATSNDVDWVKKVEMQGMLQKHIDHSISVTVNLPKDTTEEMVSNVYETAWKVGCKGITVYRDGSRDGVLISDSDKKEKEIADKFHDTHAPKRPKRVKGDIIRFQNNNEKWVSVVGLIDGRPYEIFTGLLSNGLSNIPNYVKECEIVKNIIEYDSFDENGKEIKVKKKRYDIEYIDADGNKQIATGLSHIFNKEYWNYAKLFSGMLRHGMPLIYVYELIESMNLNDDNLNTWKNGVARVIKRYIKDGVKGKGTCPDCGSNLLEFVEGCLTCKSCGNSKCS